MTVEITRLPSGLSVVTDSMPHLETAALGVWVGTGSRDERPNEHGISHLIEHMAFKGTAKRTARQIAEEIEAVGGELNAATSVEMTAYHARVLKGDVPLALDVLSDILTNPAFEPAELEREKSVIVQEIGAAEDTPDDIVFENLQITAFPGQPMGRSILGTRDSVRSFEAGDLRDYLTRNYQAPDMVIAATGAVDHARIVGHVQKLFSGFGSSDAPAPQPARFSHGAHIQKRDLEQAHIALALEGVSQRDPSLYSLDIFANVLGGGMSSRLFQEVRENRGLCYAISSFHLPYSDIGFFGLYAGTDVGDIPQLMEVVIEQIADATDTIGEAEVARVKAQMKTGLLMALESSGARAWQLARQMFAYGRVIPVAEIVARIDSVSVESVREAGKALLARSRPAVAALGPGAGIEHAARFVDGLARRAA
ncbi:MAG: M16 family metallopeptidase [Pseudorhodoplanes sp.]